MFILHFLQEKPTNSICCSGGLLARSVLRTKFQIRINGTDLNVSPNVFLSRHGLVQLERMRRAKLQ